MIIPVKSSKTFNKDLDEIEAELNAVYGGVGVEYQVTIDRSFENDISWCSSANCSFTPEGSAALSNDYTGDEKAVRDAYIAANSATLDPEAAYIFAVGNPIVQTGDENLQGKMNFGKQFGFLYSVNSLSEKKLGNTLAHELGHGNYKFYHIFDQMYLGSAAKGNTNNIMDYSTSTHLNKLQWDIIAQPGVNWGVFNKDKDQESDFFDSMKDFYLNFGFIIPKDITFLESFEVDIISIKKINFQFEATEKKLKFDFYPYLFIDVAFMTNQLLKSFEWDFSNKKAMNFKYDDETGAGFGIYPSKNSFEEGLNDQLVEDLKNTVLIKKDNYNPFSDVNIMTNLTAIMDALVGEDEDDSGMDFSLFNDVYFTSGFTASKEIIIGDKDGDAYMRIPSNAQVSLKVNFDQALNGIIDDTYNTSVSKITIRATNLYLVYKENGTYKDILNIHEAIIDNGGKFKFVEYEELLERVEALNKAQAVNVAINLIRLFVQIKKIKSGRIVKKPVDTIDPSFVNGLTLSLIEREISSQILNAIKEDCFSLSEKFNLCKALGIE